jgi:anionic cell wall polymer biosynthesis LytR-Cps2A-Psr (LCP) family protein
MKKFLLILSGIFLGGLVFLALKGSDFYNKIYTPKKNHVVKEKTAYNILLFGYGGGKHEGTYLTDTVILAHVDIKSKRVTLFSIPRDLWVKLPTKSGADFHSKINAVYQTELFPNDYPDLDPKYMGTKEDATLVKHVMFQIFGQEVDYYAAIDFEGFKKAIDIIGGIDVNVEQSFEDPEYPIDGKEKDLCDKDTEELFKKAEVFMKPGYNPEDRDRVFKEEPKVEEFVKNATESPELAFPCRYEKLEFKKGITHMNSETALKYARSRHSPTDGGDFNRAKRQQQIIEAVKNKILSIGFITRAIPLLDEFKNNLRTDVGIDEVKKFIGFVSSASEYTITSFVFTDDDLLKNAVSNDGQYILIPTSGMDQWKEIQMGVKNIMQGIFPTQSPTATPSGTLK